MSPNQIQIATIVKAELLLGAYKSKKVKINTEKVELFIEPFVVTPFLDEMTYTYAEIRGETEKKGEVIGPNDLLIAAIVKYYNGVLVTNNVREFARVKGLKIENWVC